MNTAISMLGFTVVALALVYVAGLVLHLASARMRTAAFHDAERALLEQRAQRLSNQLTVLGEQGGAGAAWAGARKFVLTGKVLEAENICSFYFAPHDGRPLPPFLPGQYLTFNLQIPGQTKQVTRCYSLSDSPSHPDYYRVTIKRLAPPPGREDQPPGVGSTFFHHGLQSGDIVDVRAPAGNFHLDTSHPAPVVLIAGGIGLTPVLSMLNHIVESGSQRDTWFFYGVRNSSEHAMKEHMREIANEHPNVHLHVCYSDPEPDDRPGADYDHAERVSVDMFKRLLPSNNFDFYVCGPPPMMDSIVQGLKEWGVPKEKIHFEAFGPASVKTVSKPQTAVGAMSVTFARSGKVLSWTGDHGSLLEFAEANGIAMESGCRAGNCGTCQTAVRAGAVEYLNEPGAPPPDGSCLTCISLPRGDLSLDA